MKLLQRTMGKDFDTFFYDERNEINSPEVDDTPLPDDTRSDAEIAEEQAAEEELAQHKYD